VKCLLIENPTRDLTSVEHEFPGASASEVRKPTPEMPVPHGPGRTPEKFAHLENRERLAQRIVRGSTACGFSYGQLCPRWIGQNPFLLLRFFVFRKLDLCKIAYPHCSRSAFVRSYRTELPFNVHGGLPSSWFPSSETNE
jgi:hypothetical protein